MNASKLELGMFVVLLCATGQGCALFERPPTKIGGVRITNFGEGGFFVDWVGDPGHHYIVKCSGEEFEVEPGHTALGIHGLKPGEYTVQVTGQTTSRKPLKPADDVTVVVPANGRLLAMPSPAAYRVPPDTKKLPVLLIVPQWQSMPVARDAWSQFRLCALQMTEMYLGSAYAFPVDGGDEGVWIGQLERARRALVGRGEDLHPPANSRAVLVCDIRLDGDEDTGCHMNIRLFDITCGTYDDGRAKEEELWYRRPLVFEEHVAVARYDAAGADRSEQSEPLLEALRVCLQRMQEDRLFSSYVDEVTKSEEVWRDAGASAEIRRVLELDLATRNSPGNHDAVQGLLFGKAPVVGKAVGNKSLQDEPVAEDTAKRAEHGKSDSGR